MKFALSLLRNGDFAHFWFLTKFRLYRAYHWCLWVMCRPIPTRYDASYMRPLLRTEFPVARHSPDHIFPEGSGTSHDNSSNAAFILKIADHIERARPRCPHSILDLGCAGGQLVRDFLNTGWMAVGLEGSDYSLRNDRAHWPALGMVNLFTCDITHPFQVIRSRVTVRFDVITAWDVIEHIPEKDLPQLFDNIRVHLASGGYFIASTAERSATYNGVEYHLTRWPLSRWKAFIEGLGWLKPADLQLKPFDAVKVTYGEESLLVYQKV